MNCPLCEKDSFKFYITFCRTHQEQVLIVNTTHKAEFTKEEKQMIGKMFLNRRIRWTMKSLPEHSHCHIEE